MKSQSDTTRATSRRHRACLIFLVFTCAYLAVPTDTYAQGLERNELEKDASWNMPNESQLADWIQQWAGAVDLDSAPVIHDLGSSINQHRHGSLGVALDLISEYFPLTHETVSMFDRRPDQTADWTRILTPDVFDDPAIPESARIQLRLAAGCWFARHERFDDALELLQPLTTDQVIDPARLLFYRGLSEHRLLQSKNCLATLNRLMEHEETIPRRFSTIAELMIADMSVLEEDSLDEVSRLMQDIRRRQALHRSGTRVIDQEKEVLEKLDQLIEEMEERMQQQQSSNSGQAQQGSSKPMEESQNASGKGSGDVADRVVEEGGEWGSMPPQKRAAALAEMAKDMPPHYREVIEEYFRQLAQESGRGSSRDMGSDPGKAGDK